MWKRFRPKGECIVCEGNGYVVREVMGPEGGFGVKVPCGYCAYKRFKAMTDKDKK